MSKPFMQGLCHRCDRRAVFHEKGIRPRYECGTTSSVFSCYMYAPVRPLVLRRTKGDRRNFMYRESPAGLLNGYYLKWVVKSGPKKARQYAEVFLPYNYTLVANPCQEKKS